MFNLSGTVLRKANLAVTAESVLKRSEFMPKIPIGSSVIMVAKVQPCCISPPLFQIIGKT